MPNNKKGPKKRSTTSTFGVSKRESHDSSQFYKSKLYSGIPKPKNVEYIDNSSQISTDVLDHVILGDSRNMKELPDCSVHLVVTSPPYNVSKEHDNDLTLDEYLNLLETVFKEVWRVLVPGGRVAINVANVGRKPYIPLHSFIIQMILNLNFHMRGEIIWDKGASAGISTAWGSFASASNPCLRDVHEYILIFSKLTNKLGKLNKKDSISKKNFIEWSKSIWRFPAESARKIGHPAPFPLELPLRLIEFYSHMGDIVLDPFIGSGTTAIAAIKLKRHYIGYEISSKYYKLAMNRISEYNKQSRINDFIE
ncbi:MAG: DNA-methyltransferase [Promethearchaeota archaeon]